MEKTFLTYCYQGLFLFISQFLLHYDKNVEFAHLLKTIKSVILLVSKGNGKGTGQNQGLDLIKDKVWWRRTRPAGCEGH